MVIERACSLCALPFQEKPDPLPADLAGLDYDKFHEIQFRRDQALLASSGRFRLHLFHRGYLFKDAVKINIIDGGEVKPIAYAKRLFDYGKNQIGDVPDIGFAGFKMIFPLNGAEAQDEVISFLGASYFRILSKGQSYGLSARALAIDTYGDRREEFPVFREFWVTQPKSDDASIEILALLDSASTTGAYRFVVTPDETTSVAVEMVLFPRVDMDNVGLAPLSSMYFYGGPDSRPANDFRPQVHDSDGLQIATGPGSWLWAPLNKKPRIAVRTFPFVDPRGFGLLQRERRFQAYQDLEARYNRRPGYWIEPTSPWGAGKVLLMELPTDNETQDNVVALWKPDAPLVARKPAHFSYRLSALSGTIHPLGVVDDTFLTDLNAKIPDAANKRITVDFAGGSLSKHADDATGLTFASEAVGANILSALVVANPEIAGVRVVLDLATHSGAVDLSGHLLSATGEKLTERWAFSIGDASDGRSAAAP